MKNTTPTLRLTDAIVNKLRPPTAETAAPARPRPAYYRDSATPGLQLRVMPSGVKTFVLARRMGGRPVRWTLGQFPAVSTAQARRQAVRLAGQVSFGQDPTEERRKVREESTLAELFTLYLEGHAKPHKRSWKADVDQFDRYLAPWRPRKLSTLRHTDVAGLHATIGRDNGHYAANRLLALLSGMFNFAAGLGYAGGNPAKGVKKFKELTRDRFLHADELRAFFAALAVEPDPWPDLFMLSLLTGARRANVLGMKWADLELTRGLWRIGEAESKSKEPLLCVLAPAAVDILQRRAETADKGKPSQYVFPSWGKKGHITEPKGAWRNILSRAGLHDLHLHDLRRTLGSWQAACGASLSIIGRSLGHKNVATTAIYARLDMDPVRASVDAAAGAIMAAGRPPVALPALPAD